jgi:disulfide bond formation protein DsbB
MQNRLYTGKYGLPFLWLIGLVWLLIVIGKGLDPADELAPGFMADAAAPVATAASELVAQPAAATAAPTPEQAAAAQPVSAGDAAKGKELFASTCAACHGPGGEGVKGLGKDLQTSAFAAGLSDEELLAFIKQGRDMSDPLNTTGIAMPPKGGNPALQDGQIVDIVAFIRSIHQ